MNKIVKLFLTAFSILGLVLIIFYFFSSANVVGTSMKPTYNNGDLLVIAKCGNYKVKDIVAVKSSTSSDYLCKRIIGVGGDDIIIEDSKVILNGKPLDESYVFEDTWSCQAIDDSFTGATVYDDYDFHIKVDDGYIFVLGDNRNHSADSRSFGCLPVDNVIGKSTFNITKSIGVNKRSLRSILIVIWALYIIYYIKSKKSTKV